MNNRAPPQFLLGGGWAGTCPACFGLLDEFCWITSGFSLCCLPSELAASGGPGPARSGVVSSPVNAVIVNGTATAKGDASTAAAPSPASASGVACLIGMVEAGARTASITVPAPKGHGRLADRPLQHT